jgi:hypothetical protein
MASVRKRTIPTERPPLVSEVSDNFLRIECSTWSTWRIPILGFLDRSRYYFLQVAPQLYSRGWVDPVPDPLLFCSTRNRTRDLQICGKELWPLDHRGGLPQNATTRKLESTWIPNSISTSISILSSSLCIDSPNCVLLQVSGPKFWAYLPFSHTWCTSVSCISISVPSFSLCILAMMSLLGLKRWWFTEQWLVCTPLSMNIFVTLITHHRLEYNCKALFETPCISVYSCF